VARDEGIALISLARLDGLTPHGEKPWVERDSMPLTLRPHRNARQ
jgi:hypothetical protein